MSPQGTGTLRLKFSEKAAVSERTPATDLLNHLLGQRAHLIAKMSNAHQRGGDVAGWLPLLSQTQAGIEAVEDVMEESVAVSLPKPAPELAAGGA